MKVEQSDPRLTAALSTIVAIGLDWNGTTVNDTSRAMRATNHVLAEREMAPLNLEEFRSTFQLPMDRYFLGLGLSHEDLESAIAQWNHLCLAEPTSLSEGVVELLGMASQFELPVGVVSAASADVVRTDAIRLGIGQSLAFIRGSARSKSDSLRDLSLTYGGRVLYCGDTEYDVIEARSAGAVVVAFGGGYRSSEALRKVEPDFLINDFHALTRALPGARQSRMHWSSKAAQAMSDQ